jgi:hypothetical protein
MPLYREGPPVIVGRFDRFHDAVRRACGHSHAGRDIENALVMERIHGDLRLADRLREARPGFDRYIVYPGCAIITNLVGESIWNFGGYILNERSSECDIQQLRAPADCENRQSHFPGGLYERDLGVISRDVGFMAFRRSGLSIQRRFYIFAAGEQQSVYAGKNCVYGFITLERRDDNWYEPCTLECIHVRIVEPDAMGISIAFVRGRRNGDDCGCRGRAI